MSIKLMDLGLIILFVLGIAVGTYIIILIKNLNSSIKVVKKLLKDNEENINKTLIDIPIISKNMVEITDTAKNELLVMGNAINSINETIEMTTATVSTFKNDIFGKISGIIGIIDVIKHIFFKDKDEKVD
jgi:predicted PurR-regulated permease PerM